MSARDENARTLATVFGLDEADATQLLEITVHVAAASDPHAQIIRHYMIKLLERTGVKVDEVGASVATVAVVIGSVEASIDVPVVRVGVTTESVVVSCKLLPDHSASAEIPAIVLLLAGCYAAGMAVRLGCGAAFSLPSQDTILVPVDIVLNGQRAAFEKPVELDVVYLAGAGAIGNGFLWALATVDCRGELNVVDPKDVSHGNLSRCMWLHADDVGLPKATQLVARAQPSLSELKLVARVATLQQLAERNGGPWLKKLIVGVDSRRARRRLQDELPRDVFDASTTGIEEIVVHTNSGDVLGACLSCIYHEDPEEDAHEQHVAEMLGVDVLDVKMHYVSGVAAARIIERHPNLSSVNIEGLAYDTLFKNLCGAGELGVSEGRTVLAPLSFVSVLAGTYLAIELVCRTVAGNAAFPFNYWRASPWASPVFALRSMRPRRDHCETCGKPAIREIVRALWEQDGEESA